jgi:SAM-dependent methyltransferase
MNEQKYNFGGSWVFEHGTWIIGAICFVVSLFLFFHSRSLCIQVWSLPLLLLSVNFIIGSIIAQGVVATDYLTLPFVDLFSSDRDHILDAGCGSGRTTVVLGRVSKNGQITALDLFDPNNQGDLSRKDLLEKNLKIAKITERVRIVQGDVTRLEFPDDTFDAAASTLLLNNLGTAKLIGLKELFRVLKPDGKMLVVLPTPSLQTFAVMNVFCFMLTPREAWRSLFQATGFRLLDEGVINFGTFFLIQKPGDGMNGSR